MELERISAVIWITGLPNVGKTTVGDLVSNDPVLRERASIIRLDGDLLRFVLQTSEVDSDTDRRNLGVTYARLALSLARQGHLVVVSVVAMYAEVFAELASSHIPVLTVHIDAEFEDLKSRDWRGVFGSAQTVAELSIPMELPQNVFTLRNSSDLEPEQAARTIGAVAEKSGLLTPSAACKSTDIQQETWVSGTGSIGRHWDGYYLGQNRLPEPSSFAHFVNERAPVQSDDRVLDYGCGNGRDSFYFGAQCATLGLDISRSAIDMCRRFQADMPDHQTTFMLLAPNVLEEQLERFRPTIVYCRFVLHAMTDTQESSFLDAIASRINPGTRLYIECRTVNDPLFLKGIKLSKTERVYGHYRRFIEPEGLRTDLCTRGFSIQYASEARGVARLGSDDPTVLRVLASKSAAYTRQDDVQ